MKGQKKQEDNSPIQDFNGHYQFLNNDHPAWVSLDGMLFPSVAVAYQAARTNDPSLRLQLAHAQTYDQIRKIAIEIEDPPQWQHHKNKVMERLVRDKIKRSREISGKLAATHPRTLINSYKQGGQVQRYWGFVQGKGQNTLGKILMSLREQLLGGTDNQRWINDQGVQNDASMRAQVSLVVSKDEKPIDKLFLQKKNKFFFGALPSNDFKLDHPSISKVHACIYFATDFSLMLVDMGSSHGTALTRQQKIFKLEILKPVALEQGDIIVFGQSSRQYRVLINVQKVQRTMKDKQRQVEQQIASIKQKGSQRSRSRSKQK